MDRRTERIGRLGAEGGGMRTCREAAGRQPRAVRPSVRPVVSHAAVATWSARRALDWQGPLPG